jgi:serine/threonine protein kinase/tetratricopeptide (TPR) repeat protein
MTGASSWRVREADPRARYPVPVAKRTPPLPLLPDRYKAIRFIGEGATGEVFLARDQAWEADVAFKVVRKNLAVHRRFRARFAREVALSARVVHPHLVPVHDSGVLADGRPFVAMAHAERGNLKDLLHQGFQIRELLRLSEQVCRALAALHARRLVHQDLKPENVLLHTDADGNLASWVADLGVADELHSLTRDARRVGGTPIYMAPEQLQGKAQEFGPWTDLYALGLMLYEGLSGRRPHEATGRKQLLELRQHPPPPLIPLAGAEIPDELHDLVLSLLDPEPRQRFDRAADVRRRLRAARALLPAGDTVSVTSVSQTTELETTDPVAKALAGRRLDQSGALRWNRVPPKTLPETPPTWLPPNVATASLRLFALREVPLVGRDEELQAIWDVAGEVMAKRRPRVVLVVGAGGSGRTALVETACRMLDEGAWMEVVRLRYRHPPGPDDGYVGAVREILAPWNDTRDELQMRLARWVARDRETKLVTAMREAVLLARWCGFLRPGERRPNAAMGLHFLYQHLHRRGWRGGSCLVMDDAHLAEEPGDGLDMAEALLDGAVGERPVLVLATLTREALQTDVELAEKVEGLVDRGALRVDLDRLGKDRVHQVLSETLFLDPALAEDIARRIEGYPLHAGMLLRTWAARGYLEPDEQARFRLKNGIDLRRILPRDLDELYALRLQAAVEATEHPKESAMALAAVALAGQAPPFEIVRDVSETGLDSLLATGLLRQEAGLLRFEQGALEDTARTLAEALPEVAEIHGRLADAWRRLGERTGADVDMPLGQHRLESGQSAASVGPLLRALRTLLEQGRFALANRAADLAITAADLAATADNPLLARRMEARRLKGLALLELDDPEGAARIAEEAGHLGWGERLTRTRLTVLRARAYVELDRADQARALLSTAHASFWAMRDKDGLAEVALRRADQARGDNRIYAAEESYDEVLQSRPLEDPRVAQALSAMVTIRLSQGRPEDAWPYVTQLAEAAALTGDTRTSARANFAAGSVRLAQGRHDEAERLFLTAQANAATSGDLRMQVNAVNYLGEVARYRGDNATARSHYTRYVRLAKAARWPLAEAVGRVNLALIELSDGSWSRADMHAARAGQSMARQPRSWVWVYVSIVRAACAAAQGDEPRARQWWELSLARGLKTLRSGDLWGPVQALARQAEGHGWDELENAAWEQLAMIRRS